MPIENKMIPAPSRTPRKSWRPATSPPQKRAAVRRRDEQPGARIIYGQRGKVLRGEDVSENVHTMIHESIAANAQLFLAGEVADDWDFDGLRSHYRGWLAKDGDFRYTPKLWAS